MRHRSILALIVVVASFTANAQTRPPSAAIAAAHPAATAAGREILESGGNAFDAAVAVAAALAVVEPFSSGLGGGGFFLLHRESDGSDVMLDARERAPLAARADMYLDAKGQPIPRASLDGPRAAAIPGLPAGLAHLAQRYGKLPLARTLAPAVRLARAGFAVTPHYRRFAQFRAEALIKSGAASIFLDGKDAPAEGALVRQPDLARTLEQLAGKGAAGFYQGDTAHRLVESVRSAGGIWTLADLDQYRVIERAPLRGRYRGAKIVTAALPSSGGILLLEMLGMLESFDLEPLAPAERAHVLIEVMRRAYGDRALYLGDPDFMERNLATQILDPRRITDLKDSIDRARATASKTLPSVPAMRDGAHTTHFSIIDTAGNRVSATVTINIPFGSGFVAAGTGVLLNNEMDDFALAPDVPNVYGLTGGPANAIAPGKRPLSSMTPTFIETRDAVAVLGTPGGSRIISMVLLAALDFMQGGGDVRKWVSRPRFHHQYLPDRVSYEPNAFTADEAELLRRKGHELLSTERPYGNMQAVVWNRAKNRVEAASDPRGEGAADVFAIRERRASAAAR
jgi:gamma-glutamyltranspeptidase/glutathione hydrolase